MLVVGVLSGTSVDGIDVAVVEIQEEQINNSGNISNRDKYLSPTLNEYLKEHKIQIKQIAFEIVPFTEEERSAILHLCSTPKPEKFASVRDLCVSNFNVGESFGRAILKVLEKHNIDKESVSLIGSHGIAFALFISIALPKTLIRFWLTLF
jgi:anhydro-N-acetylmuramic acid kinase